jgi:hypothetical protein
MAIATATIGNIVIENNYPRIDIVERFNTSAKERRTLYTVVPVSKGVYTFVGEADRTAFDNGEYTNGTFPSKEAAAEAAFDFAVEKTTELEAAFSAGYPAAAAQKTTLLKTKYTRKNVKGTESFTAYELSLPEGNVSFPKGATLPQIKKLYPHLDITVAVMPSIALKGLTRAACEDIKEAMVSSKYGGKKPANVSIEPATAEELEADLTTEPADAIYTIESERPKAGDLKAQTKEKTKLFKLTPIQEFILQAINASEREMSGGYLASLYYQSIGKYRCGSSRDSLGQTTAAYRAADKLAELNLIKKITYERHRTYISINTTN